MTLGILQPRFRVVQGSQPGSEQGSSGVARYGEALPEPLPILSLSLEMGPGVSAFRLRVHAGTHQHLPAQPLAPVALLHRPTFADTGESVKAGLGCQSRGLMMMCGARRRWEAA